MRFFIMSIRLHSYLVKKTGYNVEEYSTKFVLYGMRLDIGDIDIEAKRRVAAVTVFHVQKYDLIANAHDLV